MKKLFYIGIIASFLLLGITSCAGNIEKEESDYRTNGQLMDLFAEEGWKSYCADDACYLQKDDDKDSIFTIDDTDKYMLIQKDVDVSDAEIQGYLEWMERRKDSGMLDEGEITSGPIFSDTEDTSENETAASDKEEKNSSSSNSVSSNKPDSNSSSSDKTESQQKPSNNSSSNSSVSVEMRNALRSANNYLNVSAFSRSGLIDQLTYEGYSTSAATYAADHCGADWNDQALKSAKDYLNVSAFSKSGLKEQLTYEGFTSSQADYGVSKCGADWNEQAAKSAQNYLDIMSFSRQELIDQLIFEGFSQSQAEYGVSAAGY